MLKKAVGTLAPVFTGAVIDRASQTREPAPGQTEPGPRFQRGDERLGQIADRRRLPENAPHPVVEGISSQVSRRANTLEKLRSLTRQPEQARQNVEHMGDDIKSNIEFMHGVAQVAQEGLSIDDGKRLASAAAEATGNSVMSGLSTAYSVSTTSKEGVDKLTHSVAERAEHDAKAAAAGLAVSQGIATALNVPPHPAFKAASAAVRISGQMAFGAGASETLRTAHGDPESPINREIVAIAKERAQ